MIAILQSRPAQKRLTAPWPHREHKPDGCLSRALALTTSNNKQQTVQTIKLNNSTQPPINTENINKPWP